MAAGPVGDEAMARFTSPGAFDSIRLDGSPPSGNAVRRHGGPAAVRAVRAAAAGHQRTSGDHLTEVRR